MRTLTTIFSVTLCATVFFACGARSPQPVKDSPKLQSGEELATTVSDAARKAEADKNTGIISESSQKQTVESPETQPAETQPAQPTVQTIDLTFENGTLKFDGKVITQDSVLKKIDDADETYVRVTIKQGVDATKLVEALKRKGAKVVLIEIATTQPTE